ncbi:hypothetical protein JCM4914_63780 [Streptomyces platensis subsp. malvinus]
MPKPGVAPVSWQWADMYGLPLVGPRLGLSVSLPTLTVMETISKCWGAAAPGNLGGGAVRVSGA